MLGCTHYPALHESAERGPEETHTFQSYLRESLDKHGMQDVQIINPMAYQARAGIRHLRDHAAGRGDRREQRQAVHGNGIRPVGRRLDRCPVREQLTCGGCRGIDAERAGW